MSNNNIFDDLTAERERADYDDIDIQQTAVQVRGQQAVSGMQGELQALAAMAAGKTRDTTKLIKAARRTGELLAQRGKAVYSFPAGGGRVEGLTVDAAEALAAEYGHLYSGVRIDGIDGDRVYLTAMVFDVLAGTATTRPHVMSLPPAPGKFASKAHQVARWESMQVQSAVSKAVRTTLLHALPGWMTAECFEAAQSYGRQNALKGKTPQQAAEDVFDYYEALGISRERVIEHVGAAVDLWTVSDIVDLRVLAKRLRDGETTVAREFPAMGRQPTQEQPRTGMDGLKRALNAPGPETPDYQEEADRLAQREPVRQQPAAEQQPAEQDAEQEQEQDDDDGPDRAPCSVCGRDMSVKKDGNIRAHKAEDSELRCAGTDQPPASAEPEGVDDDREALVDLYNQAYRALGREGRKWVHNYADLPIQPAEEMSDQDLRAFVDAADLYQEPGRANKEMP